MQHSRASIVQVGNFRQIDILGALLLSLVAGLSRVVDFICVINLLTVADIIFFAHSVAGLDLVALEKKPAVQCLAGECLRCYRF